MLRGLGAFAIASPALAALSCSDDSGKMTGPTGEAGAAEAGTSAAGGTGAAGSLSSGSAGSGVSAGAGGRIASSSSGAGGAGAPAAAGRGGSEAGASSVAGRGGAGASGMPAAGGAGGAPAAGSGAAGATASMPTFPDAGTCMLTTTDIEGPFYIDEAEVMDDVSMVRADIRDGHKGVEFRLHFRMLDARKSCAPIANAELYVWHCDADGYYSGFSGQDPTVPYMGSANPSPSNVDRFCRGIQLSDAMGVASFTSIYPGWYAGRPLHVHLMARIKGQAMTRLITTQLYFPADFTVDVHTTEPAYMARSANIPAGSVNPPSGMRAIPAMQHTKGLVTGTLNVIVNG
jgi:protocatechuate 3,4-dioxygenase beta subunit